MRTNKNLSMWTFLGIVFLIPFTIIPQVALSEVQSLHNFSSNTQTEIDESIAIKLNSLNAQLTILNQIIESRVNKSALIDL